MAATSEAQTCRNGDPATALGTYFLRQITVLRRQALWMIRILGRRPGVTNPRVTKANIGQNICSKDFKTAAFRPKPAYTNAPKRKQLREYGDTVKDPDASCVEHSNNPRCYEEDHLIALEDGGNPFDPRNLWPEPTNKMPGVNGAGWESKDIVESFLQDAICFDIPNHKTTSRNYHPSHSIPLQRAEEILAQDWYACYQESVKGRDCQ